MSRISCIINFVKKVKSVNKTYKQIAKSRLSKEFNSFTELNSLNSTFINNNKSIFTNTQIKSNELKQKINSTDSFTLTTKSKQKISIEETKKLYPTGKLEDNYIIQDINNLLSQIITEKKIIDLTSKLSKKDYKIIQKFLNKDNGHYIKLWNELSDTDPIPNLQKLAIFTRTMRLTKQSKDFLEFNPNQWNIVIEGIVKKPRNIISPVFEYKINSNPINIPLSEKKITLTLKTKIDTITNYINMFTVKKNFVAYRGDKSFNILSNIKYNNQNIDLAKLIKSYSLIFKDMYNKKTYNQKAVNDFVKKYLLGQKIEQQRFLSVGMTESAIKNYAKAIKWNILIPKGTKGASIESFNIERLKEAEFLCQRNSVLVIQNAQYSPKKDLWIINAKLEQNPIDEIIVNC
ncbi:MAG: hypothetical protein Q4E83_00390 [bacterium]|nr:hypothetical protein [bacterium]